MNRRAFTLVEALVTVTIVAVLVALLLPGLRAARGAARTTMCSSNLRQISTACGAYEASNGAMPAAVLYFREGGGVRTVAWDFAQHGGEWQPGPLWTYTDAPSAVQQCPDFEGPSNFGADPYTGYNYNTTFIGAEGRLPEIGPDGDWLHGWSVARRGLATGNFRKTSTTALFGDGGWRGGANKFMRAPSATVEGDLPTVYAGAQAFRHGGCTHVCYLDGHVAGACQACEGEHSSQSLLDQVMGFPKNGFLADGDGPYDPR